MKIKRYIIIFFVLVSCTNQDKNADWKSSFDFDNDKKKDSIRVSYTQGANCCYLLKIKLSSKDIWEDLNLEINGGYLYGLDLSRPNNFNILDIDQDKLPEIIIDDFIETNSKYYIDFIKETDSTTLKSKIIYKQSR